MAAGGPHTTMSSHDSDAPGHEGAVSHHETTDHGEDHGHDDHGHGEDALGPIDVAAWGAGAIGLAVGAGVALCFALATGAIH